MPCHLHLQAVAVERQLTEKVPPLLKCIESMLKNTGQTWFSKQGVSSCINTIQGCKLDSSNILSLLIISMTTNF